MQKIKWRYDKKKNEWIAEGSNPDSNIDSFSIRKLTEEVFEKKYVLQKGEFRQSKYYYFKKLSSAKKVAQLLRYG